MPGPEFTPALFAASAGIESASRNSRFAVSLLFHATVVFLLPVIAPRAALHSVLFAPRTTPLVAPVEPPVTPAPVQAARRAPIQAPVGHTEARLFVPPKPARAPQPRPGLRESPPVIRSAEVPTAPASLAPVLPAAPSPSAPAVRTNVFAEAPAKASPPFSVPQRAQSAGFDQVAKLVVPATPRGHSDAASGFDQGSPARSAVTGTPALQTGAFAAAGIASSTVARAGSGHPGAAGFDQLPGQPKAAPLEAVRRAGFDAATPAAAPKTAQSASAPARITPVEVLDKPKPAYTEEARRRNIQGTVLLDVVFTAAGQVRVLGILRPLGHGLDDAAIDAARRIRFKPAVQAGVPVDQRATLRIVFEMTQ